MMTTTEHLKMSNEDATVFFSINGIGHYDKWEVCNITGLQPTTIMNATRKRRYIKYGFTINRIKK